MNERVHRVILSKEIKGGKRGAKMKYKWIITLIAAALLCATNIVLAAVWRDEATNIFTAVSGWISGIATASLGGVALWQSRKHQLENSKQTLIQMLTVQKNDFEDMQETFIKRKTIIDMIREYLEKTPQKDQTTESLSYKIDALFTSEELRSIRLVKAKVERDISFVVNKKELIEALLELESDILKYLFEAKDVNDLSYGFHRFEDRNSIASSEFGYFIAAADAQIKEYLSMQFSEIIKDQERMRNENYQLVEAMIAEDSEKWDRKTVV